jgi:hypothetical protein
VESGLRPVARQIKGFARSAKVESGFAFDRAPDKKVRAIRKSGIRFAARAVDSGMLASSFRLA